MAPPLGGSTLVSTNLYAQEYSIAFFENLELFSVLRLFTSATLIFNIRIGWDFPNKGTCLRFVRL